MVSVDVKTACHLGICTAVRLTEAVPMVNSSRENTDDQQMFTTSQLQSALRKSGLGKPSKQRFLRSSSRDPVIKVSRKGAGGNATPYGCFIVQQNELEEETVDLLRKGIDTYNIVARLLPKQ